MAKFKAVLVGAGGMGKEWGKNLTRHADVEISAWVDIRPESAAAAVEEMKQWARSHAEKEETSRDAAVFEAKLSDVLMTDDLKKAITETKPDFVVDVTIPEAHRDVTVTALGMGVPVLGEKPMAASMAQAREMVAASEAAGKLYMVSQSRRYDGRIHAYRQLIAANLGALGILNSDFYIGAHFGGFRDAMDSPLILDMAIHTFDAARYLCDSDPVAVYCDEFNPSWSWYKGDVSATAIFEMANGLRYTYRGSWCSEGEPTSWEGDWRAVGEKGTALWNGHDTIQAGIVTKTGGFHSDTETITAAPTSGYGGISGSLRDFLNALETGATPMGECHDNIKSLAMVFAAIESARTGQKIRIDAI